MTKKLTLLIIIVFIFILPAFSDQSNASLWMQMNSANSLALNLDLSKTIALPSTGSQWGTTGYNNDNYLGKVGALGISDPVYMTVTCNKVDANGNFIMGSDSNHNLLYRKIKIGLAYRKADNNNSHSNYTPSGQSTSFFTFNRNGDAPFPIPKSDRSNNISYSWIDFLIILEAPSSDIDHLGSANDYSALLTITLHTADNRFSQTMSLPLLGYYDSAPNDLAGECFFYLTDYAKTINLKTDFVDQSTQITVGHLNLASNSMNKNSTKQYKVYVSPTSNYLSTEKFYMRRISTTSNTLGDQNSVPIKIVLEGEHIINTNIKLGDLATETSGYVNATAVAQDPNGYIQAVTGESNTKNLVYNADIKVSLATGYDMTKLERLISGEYYCDVYFTVFVDE